MRITVVALVSDCLGANIVMANLLVCRAHERSFDDLKTPFLNRVDDLQDIFMVFHAYHDIKVLRNLLGETGTLLGSTCRATGD